MLELQNDDIYELVIDNSYFIFIGNDSFNEEIDYFREVSAQQPFSIITDSDNQYSKFGEVLLSADTKSNKDAFRGCPACFLILKGVVISSHETNRFS